MTGARLPEGADAVVPVEWTDGGTEFPWWSGTDPKTWSNAVRHRGDDVAEGTVLLSQGTLIGPVQLALLAASGQGEVLARTPPRVAVISTGNELVEPGTPLIPGQIWESNSFMLAAAAQRAGAIVRRHRLRDDPAVVLSTLEGLLSDADLLITSGGVSMGERARRGQGRPVQAGHDHVPQGGHAARDAAGLRHARPGPDPDLHPAR